MPNVLKFIGLYLFIFLFSVSSKPIFSSSINIKEVNLTEITDINQEIKVSADINIKTADNTVYYLRGVFFKQGQTNYCGYTYNGKDWYKGPHTVNEGWKNFLPVTISSDSASLTLSSRFDNQDSGCKENGIYKFKIQRFTTSGSSDFDLQNELAVNVLLSLPIPSIAPTPSKKPTVTPKPTSTPKPVSTLKPMNTLHPTVITNTEASNIFSSEKNAQAEASTEKSEKSFEKYDEEELSASGSGSNGENKNGLLLGVSTDSRKIRNETMGTGIKKIILLFVIGAVFLIFAAIKLFKDIKKNKPG
jgi:hypothetical protein